MKLYETIFLIDDEGDDGEDPDGIAKRGRYITVKSEARLSCVHRVP